MTDLVIHGGKPLRGVIRPAGNKNAVLPIICASVLGNGKTRITNVPAISDVEKLVSFLVQWGVLVEWNKQEGLLEIEYREDSSRTLPELPSGIRSAVLLLAPVLVRSGQLLFDSEAKGCALGAREIDPHLQILSEFGCRFKRARPYELVLDERFEGKDIWLDYASVTATETFLMIAATAEGVSRLTNAASEPHVQALCYFLQEMGAVIEGIGTSQLTVHGVHNLSSGEFVIPDDHHEVATFLAIGGVTGGDILIETAVGKHMTLIDRQFRKLGINTEIAASYLRVNGWSRDLAQPYTDEILPKIEAAPWPYFPADLLPQAVGVAVGCNGNLMFWNKVYEGALTWSSELSKFGAKVTLADPHRLIVFGGQRLRPAVVEAPYIIRVVLGLFIAAIQIEGKSIIRHADPILRAHPNFVQKLCELGAEVEWA